MNFSKLDSYLVRCKVLHVKMQPILWPFCPKWPGLIFGKLLRAREMEMCEIMPARANFNLPIMVPTFDCAHLKSAPSCHRGRQSKKENWRIEERQENWLPVSVSIFSEAIQVWQVFESGASFGKCCSRFAENNSRTLRSVLLLLPGVDQRPVKGFAFDALHNAVHMQSHLHFPVLHRFKLPMNNKYGDQAHVKVFPSKHGPHWQMMSPNTYEL